MVMVKHKASMHEILRYLLVGGLAALIDFIFYLSIVNLALMPVSWAKRLSFTAGAIWSFFANRKFTFRNNAFKIRQPVLFALIYITGFAINSLVHDMVFRYSSHWSFPAAVFCSTVWNYSGQKFLVFRVNRT